MTTADTLSITPGAGLFDNEAVWHSNPAEAFRALITETAFGRTRSAEAVARPNDLRMAADSAAVYMTMFGRYVQFLGEQGVALPRVGVPEVGRFFEQALSARRPLSRSTYRRYLRLIERVYEHLKDRGIVSANPVSAWVQAGQEQPTQAQLRPNAVPPMAGAAEVLRLHQWLHERGRLARVNDDWKALRNVALASLALGAGMRCTELLVLARDQVQHRPDAHGEDPFRFTIPPRATVRTAREHETATGKGCPRLCVETMQAWWHLRWTDGFRCGIEGAQRHVAQGALVFPATLDGRSLSRTTLFTGFKALAQEAVKAGALTVQSEWMLTTGAQGLRRAFVLSQLEGGADPALLAYRLGHHGERAVQDYQRQLGGATSPRQQHLTTA